MRRVRMSHLGTEVAATMAESVLREEKTTRRWAGNFSGHGGKLTLTESDLIWIRSGMKKQKPIVFSFTGAWFGAGPRRPNYYTMLLAPLGGVVYEFLSGGLRKTLEVRTSEETYWFSVKDVSGWVGEIANLGGRIISA